jgi:hypothetical protein
LKLVNCRVGPAGGLRLLRNVGQALDHLQSGFISALKIWKSVNRSDRLPIRKRTFEGAQRHLPRFYALVGI